VLFAVVLVVLFGGAALAIDIGHAYYTQRALQASADASALAGSQALPDSATAQNLARQYSGTSGSKNASANVPGVVTSVTVKCLSSGTCTSPNAVAVDQSTDVSSIFAKVFGINVFHVSARATACSGGPGVTYLVDDGGTTCPFAVTQCVIGYPFSSGNPRTSVTFNESAVLRAFAPQIAGSGDTIKVWYNDEHALTLGVRQVAVKTASGTTTSNFPVAPLSSNPGSSSYPAVGSTVLTGDNAGTDTSARPMFPALYLTDITADQNSKAGDWQYLGSAIPPSAVFGTWKAAVKTIDKTMSPATVSVTPDADPSKNNWSLGAGSDTPPSGLANEGFGAEARWNVNDLGVQPGHAYRMQFMVHDGDQNKTGGDSGQACMAVIVSH
jgi:Flp pilus assembly protein TadG